MYRENKTLAEVLSGDPHTICSQDMEKTVSRIRGSNNWIQRIAQECKKAQRQDDEYLVKPSVANGVDSSLPDHSSSHISQSEGFPELDRQNITCQFEDNTHPDMVQDAIPLINRFESWESQEHLYPVYIQISETSIDEHMEITKLSCASDRRLKLAMFMLAQTAMVAYIVILWHLLRNQKNSPFVWHSILMSVSLVLVTEAVAIIQYTSWPILKCYSLPSRIFYYLLHISAGITQIVGIAHCWATLTSIDTKSKNISSHSVVGIITMLLFFGMLMLGMYIKFLAPVLGLGEKAKLWLKYYRGFGYITLLFMWISACFGIHTRWLRNLDGNLKISGIYEWALFGTFAIILISLLFLINRSKLGFRQVV